MALHYYGGIFRRNVAASGVVPQISVIMGSCAGGAVYSPAITDFVFMVQGTSQMFITGPDVVKTVTGEDVTLEELGGAITHATKSGVASFVAPDEKSCLDQVRRLLGYLPPNNVSSPRGGGDERRPTASRARAGRPGARFFPRALRHEDVVRAVLDGGEFFEYHALWALNLVCGFGRIGGRVIGVVANQPQVLAGVLDIDATEKGARFVRTCDCFNIPVVTFVDVPGFMPGTDQEHGGMARRGAKLLYAYCEAAVPKIQMIVRRAYGAAYVVMGSKSLGADLAYAWPGAELAVVGPESAVDLLYSSELAGAPPERRREMVDAYKEGNANPYLAAERGYIDDVIEPASTRRVLYQALEMLASKRQEAPPVSTATYPCERPARWRRRPADRAQVGTAGVGAPAGGVGGHHHGRQTGSGGCRPARQGAGRGRRRLAPGGSLVGRGAGRLAPSVAPLTTRAVLPPCVLRSPPYKFSPACG